jgi:hypothetical protein
VGRAGGRAGIFFGGAGHSFLTQFGRTHFKTSIWASHFGRAERLFSVEVGSARCINRANKHKFFD